MFRYGDLGRAQHLDPVFPVPLIAGLDLFDNRFILPVWLRTRLHDRVQARHGLHAKGFDAHHAKVFELALQQTAQRMKAGQRRDCA